MSDTPFFYHSPTPRYFRDNGLFKNPKNKAFVDWCFERCCPETREIFHDNQKLTLHPYQFIFGRAVCMEETGLTEDEIRTQQKRWEKQGFLKKAPNKTPNRFTVYEWVLTCFIKTNPQQNPRCTPNKPPAGPPQSTPNTTPNTDLDKGNEGKVLPPSKKEVKKSESKFPLKKEQQPLFELLREVATNTDDSTIKYWIRTYPNKIQTAVDFLKKELSFGKKIDNPGGFLTNIFLGKIIPMTPEMEKNKEYALEFATRNDWNNLKISGKFVKDEITGGDVPLFLPFENFVNSLLKLHDNSLTYRNL